MATTTNVTSNYTGKEAGNIIGKAFKEADTLDRGLVSVFDNVNYELNMRLINYADGTKAYSCIPDGGFSDAASGSVTLSEKVLKPVKLMLPIEQCIEDFRQTWSEDAAGQSAHNPNMPSDIQEAIQLEVLKSTAERTDRVIWQGDNSLNSNEWDGFEKLFQNDANVIKPTASAVDFSSGNVIDELDKVKSAIPRSLRRKNVVFIVSPDVADAYSSALIKAGLNNGLGGNANTGLAFGRYNLEVVNGLSDNTVAVYQKENLAFGTGLLGDHNELKFRLRDFHGTFQAKMVYNGGVQYANSEEIVYYKSN